MPQSPNSPPSAADKKDDKLWGGRFETGPSAVFERFGESLHFDKRLFEADVRGSMAYAGALERVGILTNAERVAIVNAFEQLLTDGRSPGYFDGAKDEDVHTFVIRKLKERAGAVADKIHTGRSRNEQVSLDTRLFLRGQIDMSLQRLYALLAQLVRLAQDNPAVVLSGYTHTRRAQPVLWAHYLMAYFEMFARDVERLKQARARVNLMPIGSGALAGSGFAFDRQAIAADLGFDGITRNSMDVSGDRDWMMDYLYAASMVMLHLSRLSEDWILYSGEEFGFMTLGDGVTSGSSMMPQKKNPDSLELIRGKCGRVYGELTSLFITMKGLPMTYNRDMQEDKEPLFTACDQLTSSLEMMANVCETVVLRPEAMLAVVNDSWAVATDLADALARSGVPFHQAHQVVGKLVLESVKKGTKPADWTEEALMAFHPALRAEHARLLRNPLLGMATRELPGGTGPRHVAAAVAEAATRLQQFQA